MAVDPQKLIKLKDFLRKKYTNQAEAEELLKKQEERIKIVAGSAEKIWVDFWCSRCQLDFNEIGKKVVYYPNSWHNEIRAVYVSRCPKCREWRERRITDKLNDPYYRQSKMIKVQARMHRIDMLQPNEPGFRTYYKNPYADYENTINEQEKANYKKPINPKYR